MWKTTLKILFDKFLKKAQVWLKLTGFTNVMYLGIAITLCMGVVPLFFLSFLKPYLIGASLGIFIYLNWNVIVKLIKAEVKKIKIKINGKDEEVILGLIDNECVLKCKDCDCVIKFGGDGSKSCCCKSHNGDSGGVI